jgi:hypothetical protein
VRIRRRRVGRGPREVEREREIPLELGLDERLVVGEDEAAALTALGELRRPAEGAGLGVGVVVGRAVRRVQVGPDAGVELGDGRLCVGPGVGDEERVVEGRRLDLPAVRVQQELAV